MSERMAVDIGGTFTDLVGVDGDSGQAVRSKAATQPQDLLSGVMHCIGEVTKDLASVQLLMHGTTVGINTILEGKGARTGLVTTKGFQDVYEIGRGDYPRMYQLLYDKPTALVPRYLRLEVPERLNARGEVVEPLDEGEARRVARALRANGVESVGVCLLHSYMNPKHEVRVGEIARAELPDAEVSLSSEIIREWQEYERTSTTVLNAYVQPVVGRYLRVFQELLEPLGFAGQLLVLCSNGGVVTADVAARLPVATLESGPAGGAIGASFLGRALGIQDVIAFDMGGTTAKVCLVRNGEPQVTAEYQVLGHPVRVPTVDIVEVSAGGGTIAWVDTGGAVRIGPRSAGAWPGPACYAHGGTEPTVSDANLLIGRLSPDRFLGGKLPLDFARAERAVRDRIALPCDLPLIRAALGIVTLANVQMNHAIRSVTLGRGHDPRDFAMIAYGGGGPMHAATIARELGIPQVIVPPGPGHFSAFGMLCASLRHHQVRTYWRSVEDLNVPQVNRIVQEMEEEGLRLLRSEGVCPGNTEVTRALSLSYEGQQHALELPFPEGGLREDAPLQLRRAFDEAHYSTFGYSSTELAVVLVKIHVVALGHVGKPALASIAEGGPMPPPEALRATKSVYFDAASEPLACLVYDRDKLRAGNRVPGPVLVEEEASTTVVPPGDSLEVDGYGCLRLAIGGG